MLLGSHMFKKFFSSPRVSPLEKWANHNANKASADDLIAGAIIASFAKDHKHWKFVGDFKQDHHYEQYFVSTSLSRQMGNKKHIKIEFLFKHMKCEAEPMHRYRVVGCEVNGVAVSNKAFKAILTAWQGIREKVKAAEAVAAKAKSEMETSETKWNLAEELLGMKRNGLGVLMPVKTVEE
jgi:hypothetical protein